MSDAAPARLTHLDEAGRARMVDVSAKDVTVRTATASGRVLLSPAAVAALQGAGDLSLPSVQATLTGPARSPSGRRSYLRGILDGGRVTPLSGQQSHQIASLGRANALIVVPEWETQLPAGDTVDVLVLP